MIIHSCFKSNMKKIYRMLVYSLKFKVQFKGELNSVFTIPLMFVSLPSPFYLLKRQYVLWSNRSYVYAVPE